MANIVGDIAIQIGADIAPLVTNLGKAKGEVSKFGNAAQASAGGGMKAMAIAAGAIAGAAVSAGLGLAALTKASMENIDVMSKSATTLGIHTAALQAMSQVADEAGVGTEAFTKSLIKMQKGISDLASGTKAQVDAFGALGIGISDLQGKGADEQFALIADAMAKLQDPADRVSAAMGIFGKAGADIIPMVDGYRASLADATEYQRKFNIAVSDEGGKAVEAANDAMGRLTGAATGLGNQLAVTFSPIILAAANSLTEIMAGWVQIFDDLSVKQEDIHKAALDVLFKNISDNTELAAGAAEHYALSVSGLANGNISAALRKQADNIRMAAEAFKAGTMSADEYKTRVSSALEKIKALYATITQVNGADMSGAVSAMQAYAEAIFHALGGAKLLQQQVVKIGAAASSASGDGSGLTVNGGAPGTPGVSSGTTTPAVIPIPTGSGGGGGGGSGKGGGGSGNNLSDDLKAMQDRFASESEQVNKQYEESLKKLEEFRQAKLLKEQEYNDLEQSITKDHQDKLAEINNAAMQVKLSAVSGAFGDLSSLMSSHNKKLFAVGKAAALAEAIVSGYSAATSAWDKGMKIGGPPVAAAFTAASLAKTGALIAGISQTQVGGGGGGASAGSAGGGATTAPAPLQASLSLVGMGDYIRKADLGSVLDMLNKEAGDRGYKILVPA